MSMQNDKPLVLIYGAEFKLKSDGNGNGGTFINGNGGTHYHLCKFRQPLHIIYWLFASIYTFKYILETVKHFFTGFKGFI